MKSTTKFMTKLWPAVLAAAVVMANLAAPNGAFAQSDLAGTYVSMTLGCSPGETFKLAIDDNYFQLKYIGLTRYSGEPNQYEGIISENRISGTAHIDNSQLDGRVINTKPLSGIVDNDGRRLTLSFNAVLPTKVTGRTPEGWQEIPLTCVFERT